MADRGRRRRERRKRIKEEEVEGEEEERGDGGEKEQATETDEQEKEGGRPPGHCGEYFGVLCRGGFYQPSNAVCVTPWRPGVEHMIHDSLKLQRDFQGDSLVTFFSFLSSFSSSSS